MRDHPTRTPWGNALAVLLMLPCAPFAIAGDDAAHRLAETFAGVHSGAAAATDAKAQREEAARRAAEAARRAFEAARAARQRRTDEADMLERARAEAPERGAAQQPVSTERTAENARAEAARRVEAARRTAEELRQAREAEERRRTEAQRADEARQLAEKLRSARDAEAERVVREAEAEAAAARLEPRDQPLPPQLGPETAPLTPPQTYPPRAPVHDGSLPAERQRADGPAADFAQRRATVLLVLEPGSRGIRRWNKTADPMLCVGETCYVSTGAASPATALTRARAFGAGVALGSRAGACRNALGCVFRDIELHHPVTAMQPIDLRILRHDRREISDVAVDKTCQVLRRTLSCRAPVRAATYRAWIVPEDLAELAGPEALAAAVAARLPDEVSGGN